MWDVKKTREIPVEVAARKVYCEVVEGLTYDDRCLLKLSKVVLGNKTCESCLVAELEKLLRKSKEGPGTGQIRSKQKSAKSKRPSNKKGASDVKDASDTKDVKITNGDPTQEYTCRELIDLLGKSERRIQELASAGSIPAHKVAGKWHFPKEKIDRWLSEKAKPSSHCTDAISGTQAAIQEEDVRLPDEGAEEIADKPLKKEDSECTSE